MSARPVPVLALVVVTVLGVLTFGVVGAPFVSADRPRTLDPLAATAGMVPTAGGSVCVSGSAEEGPAVDLLLLAAPDGPPVDASPSDASAVTARGVLLTFGDAPQRQAIGPVAPGALELLDVATGADGWRWVGWADRPLVAWQEWRTPGVPGEPRGTIASECVPTDPATQTVIGLRTDGSHEALLRLANPFTADATFAVTFVTPDGIERPVALRNVSVTGGERVTVRLNDHVPEQSDIAAVVTVGAGRLAVEGLQRSIAAVGGVEGVAAVPAVAAPAVAWTFPWLPVGPDVEGSIWVLNPASRPVIVSVALHTPQGLTVPPDGGEVEIGPGAIVRLDAADLATDVASAFGVTVRSQTSEVIVGAGAAFLSSVPERSGLVRFAGSTSPDREWSVAGAAQPGRETVLHVLNLGEAEVRPRVLLTVLPRTGGGPPGPGAGVPPDGDDADGDDADAGDGPPDRVVPDRPPADASATVRTIEADVIAPGGIGRIVLPLDGARAWSAVVDGGEALVVARTTFGAELLEPVAMRATAATAWRVIDRPLDGRPLAGWVSRIGTDGDLRRDPRLAVRVGGLGDLASTDLGPTR